MPDNLYKPSSQKQNNKNKKYIFIIVAVIVIAVITSAIIYFANSNNSQQDNSEGASSESAASESAAEPSSDSLNSSQSNSTTSTNSNSGSEKENAAGSEEEQPDAADPLMYKAIPLPDEMRGMWVSFLELRDIDMSSEDAFRSTIITMLSNCEEININTLIFAVRPFGDALYKSEYFPWSHIISGTQGQEPAYDPLAVVIEEAHARNIRVEAWINPYRVQHPIHGPAEISEDNFAYLNPEWVKEQSGLWYDPGIPEVQQLVLDGVLELIENYEIDGIHFDDYFYPEGNTEDFDADTYALYGHGRELSAWRRNNVNTLIKDVYSGIKDLNPTISFGISPQGNNDNNFNVQFSDVKLWMSETGYTDYIMPQNYWGFDYSKNGNDSAAFENKVKEWTSYRLNENVKLYCGLGAYRIGVGDGGDSDMAEWNTGHNLADMVAYLRDTDGFSGYAFFRYGFLCLPYDSDAYEELAQNEFNALAALG